VISGCLMKWFDWFTKHLQYIIRPYNYTDAGLSSMIPFGGSQAWSWPTEWLLTTCQLSYGRRYFAILYQYVMSLGKRLCPPSTSWYRLTNYFIGSGLLRYKPARRERFRAIHQTISRRFAVLALRKTPINPPPRMLWME